MQDILALSGTQQARLIRERAISSPELIAAHLARIDEVNPALNAAIEILRESALAPRVQSTKQTRPARRRSLFD